MKEKQSPGKIGYKVRQCRELKNITREKMADYLKMSLPGYSRIERNEVDVTIERANQIAQILGISLTELINFDEKYVFNNYANNQNAFVINSDIYTENKKTQDDLISFLKSQIIEKDELINTLIKNK